MREASSGELLAVGTVAEFIYNVSGAVGSWSMAREVASVENALNRMDGVKYLAHSYPDPDAGLYQIAFRVKIVEQTKPTGEMQRAGVFGYAVMATIVTALVFTSMTAQRIMIISENVSTATPDSPVAQIAGATGKVATFGTVAVLAGLALWFMKGRK